MEVQFQHNYKHTIWFQILEGFLVSIIGFFLSLLVSYCQLLQKWLLLRFRYNTINISHDSR